MPITISNFKAKMIAKAKRKGGIWENFGQDELRGLRERIGYNPYSQDTKKKREAQAIEALDRWAMNFDQSQLVNG